MNKELDEIKITKLANLINAINKAITDLRKRRKHPLDIIPSERPTKIADELEKALDQFNN